MRNPSAVVAFAAALMAMSLPAAAAPAKSSAAGKLSLAPVLAAQGASQGGNGAPPGPPAGDCADAKGNSRGGWVMDRGRWICRRPNVSQGRGVPTFVLLLVPAVALGAAVGLGGGSVSR